MRPVDSARRHKVRKLPGLRISVRRPLQGPAAQRGAVFRLCDFRPDRGTQGEKRGQAGEERTGTGGHEGFVMLSGPQPVRQAIFSDLPTCH